MQAGLDAERWLLTLVWNKCLIKQEISLAEEKEPVRFYLRKDMSIMGYKSNGGFERVKENNFQTGGYGSANEVLTVQGWDPS